MDRLQTIQKTLGPLLAPMGSLYSQWMRRRERAYASGRKPVWRPPAPCVSVGNISMGGTGKTPMVGRLLELAESWCRSPCVLTRGYRAAPPGEHYLVRPDSPPDEAGDEPLMLAREHPSASVVVDPVRSRGGQWAAENLRPDLYLLDDGFQHLGVARDANLCLLRPVDLTADWGRVFPAGYWREGAFALRRADAFLVKLEPGADPGALADLVRERLAELDAPCWTFHLRVRGFRSLDPEEGGETADLGGEPYLLACGVAHPGQVEATVSEHLGYPPEGIMAFADHHTMDADTVRAIRAEAARRGCARVVVTPKDAVKLPPFSGGVSCVTKVDISSPVIGDDDFDQFLRGRVERAEKQ
ncbi:tetraacyldisaccharide 4'-kinase [Desulfohalovibrio reitneri]|uniref:tetraacyldisaccharide 4'-kinase n=1 Tax=Desulfohalovibrio reitneri TaxID=1307759 RepID=UPI00069007B1|nr:tetraacyldisaccharide 4'-kinase [Desulfohalovibrio reitneri]